MGSFYWFSGERVPTEGKDAGNFNFISSNRNGNDLNQSQTRTSNGMLYM
jgi:hypothetical protein